MTLRFQGMETYSSSEDEILPEANVFEFRADDILKSKIEALEYLSYSADEDKHQENKDESVSCNMDDKDEDKSDTSIEESSTSEEDDQALETSPVKPATKKSRKRATSIEDVLKSKTTKRLPMESKRKLQELQLNSTRLNRRIALENERVLSACDSATSKEVIDDDVSSRKIILKFRYLANISKLTVKMGEKFATLFVKVAEVFNLKPCELLFCVKDQTIKENDTPLDLNLKYFDIIDCIPCKLSDGKSQTENFVIKVQSNYSRNKVNVYGNRTDKLEEFMKKYSEMQDIALYKLKFEFDGELLDGSETPDDLEMENGSCIDVKIVKEKVLGVDCKDGNNEIEIVADVIGQSNQLQVCVLD